MRQFPPIEHPGRSRNDSESGFARFPRTHHRQALLSFLGIYTLYAPDVCQERTRAASLPSRHRHPGRPASVPRPRAAAHHQPPRQPPPRPRATRSLPAGLVRGAHNRYGLTLLRRDQVGEGALRCLDRLPPDFFPRLWQMPPELLPPPGRPPRRP
jgi:hypothetical protein